MSENKFIVIGNLTKRLSGQTLYGKPWLDLVIGTSSKDFAVVRCWAGVIEAARDFAEGMQIEVHGWISGNEWQGKWFGAANVRSIKLASAAQDQSAAAEDPLPPPPPEGEDIPF